MKRSPSSSPSQSLDTKPLVTPPRKAPKTAPKSSPQTPSSAVSSKDSHTPTKSPSANGTWTGEKRMMLLDEVITAGMGALDRAEVASRVGLTSQQIKDALRKGKTNLRSNVIKAAGQMSSK